MSKTRCPVVKYTGFEFSNANNTPQNIKKFKNFDYIKKKCKPGVSDPK